MKDLDELKKFMKTVRPLLSKEMRKHDLVYYLIVVDPEIGLMATAQNISPADATRLLQDILTNQEPVELERVDTTKDNN